MISTGLLIFVWPQTQEKLTRKYPAQAPKSVDLATEGEILDSELYLHATRPQNEVEDEKARLSKILSKSVTKKPTVNFETWSENWDSTLALKKYQPFLSPPNEKFVFHNKMPKCGSTTMSKILKLLAKQNKFQFYTFHETVAGSTSNHSQVLKNLDELVDETRMYKYNATFKSMIQNSEDRRKIRYLEQRKDTNGYVFLLNHHTFMDFRVLGREQPTMINVVRNPVDMFASSYSFCRHGWGNKPEYRGGPCQKMEPKDLEKSVDECIYEGDDLIGKGKVADDSNSTTNQILPKPKCQDLSKFQYIFWLCGTDKICNYNHFDTQATQLAHSYTKHKILNEYFVVGILEELDKTLKLLEIVLPRYFSRAVKIYQEEEGVAKTVNKTKTLDRSYVSEEARTFLEHKYFKYEMDLYQFVKFKLYKQFEVFGVQ